MFRNTLTETKLNLPTIYGGVSLRNLQKVHSSEARLCFAQKLSLWASQEFSFRLHPQSEILGFRRRRIKILQYALVIFLCLTSRLAFAAAPIPDAISPSNGTIAPDIAQTFTCTYSDSDGWANLKKAYLLISTKSTKRHHSVYLYYNQNRNKLYLRNDINLWWLGGYEPGSPNTIENSQVKLNCASTTVSGAGDTLTINFNVTFKTSYSGNTYNSYLFIRDDFGRHNGWTQKGIYTVNYPPQVNTISPSSGSSQTDYTVNFTTTYSDSDGWANLKDAYFLINTSTSGEKCFYGYYDQNNNKLYLRNDANTSWLGGFSPGSSNTIENSYAKLDCRLSTVSGSGNSLTIKWPAAFKGPFAGAKNTYLYTKDDVDALTGWVQKGSWTIHLPDTKPPTGTIKINSDSQYTSSVYVTLTLSATDSDSGMGTGAQMSFSNDGYTWSSPEAYTTSKSWTLTTGDGTKTVYAKYKDVAGNWSSAYSDTIILDTTAPRISSVTPADGSTRYELDPILISADVINSDPSTLEYQFSIDGMIQQAWSATSTYSWITTSNGTHSIKAEIRDVGGSDTKQVEVYILRKPIPAPD